MNTKQKWITAVAVIAVGGFYIYGLRTAPRHAPADLRDAPSDLTDMRAADIQAGYGTDIPVPEPVPAPVPDGASPGREAAAHALVIVDENIPAETGAEIKAALTASAGKILALNPAVSIEFIHNRNLPGNPLVSFLSPVSRRVVYLHEAKQLRYEWAPALKKPALFLGQKAHPDSMNIREQVGAVLDCAALLTEKMRAGR